MGKTEGSKMHDDPPESKVKDTGGAPLRHQAGDMGEKASMSKALNNLGPDRGDITGHRRIGKYKK